MKLFVCKTCLDRIEPIEELSVGHLGPTACVSCGIMSLSGAFPAHPAIAVRRLVDTAVLAEREACAAIARRQSVRAKEAGILAAQAMGELIAADIEARIRSRTDLAPAA